MRGLQLAFGDCESKSFHDELSDCRSTEEVDRMLEYLDLFQTYVGADVDEPVKRVKEAQDEWANDLYPERDYDEGR